MLRHSPVLRGALYLGLLNGLLIAQVGLTVYLGRAADAPPVVEQVTMRIPPPEMKSDLASDAARFTERFEGRRSGVYRDSRGNLTIGVGFNLDRTHARKSLGAALGPIDIDGLRDGRIKLTDGQIDALLSRDIAAAIGRARREVAGFDHLPRRAQLIVVDMVFNLGSLSKWPHFRAALAAHDFTAAAEEMAGSRWAGQTGRRAVAHIAMMRALAGNAIAGV